jgi:DNA-binding transcriptional MerR regulator
MRRLRIGELAKLSGVSADTIRHYEKGGLMPKPARTPAGYREYSETAADRVRLIQNALRFGFSLKQVGAFLGVRHAGGSPCRNVRAAGAKVLEAIDCEMAELAAVRGWIEETLAVWDLRLAQTPEGEPAHLLETFGPSSIKRTVRRRGLNQSPH